MKFELRLNGADVANIKRMDELARQIQVASQIDGNKTCCTFGQIFLHDGRPASLRGRLFTGEAAQVLYEAVEKAAKMQNAIDGKEKAA